MAAVKVVSMQGAVLLVEVFEGAGPSAREVAASLRPPGLEAELWLETLEGLRVPDEGRELAARGALQLVQADAPVRRLAVWNGLTGELIGRLAVCAGAVRCARDLCGYLRTAALAAGGEADYGLRAAVAYDALDAQRPLGADVRVVARAARRPRGSGVVRVLSTGGALALRTFYAPPAPGPSAADVVRAIAAQRQVDAGRCELVSRVGYRVPARSTDLAGLGPLVFVCRDEPARTVAAWDEAGALVARLPLDPRRVRTTGELCRVLRRLLGTIDAPDPYALELVSPGAAGPDRPLAAAVRVARERVRSPSRRACCDLMARIDVARAPEIPALLAPLRGRGVVAAMAVTSADGLAALHWAFANSSEAQVREMAWVLDEIAEACDCDWQALAARRVFGRLVWDVAARLPPDLLGFFRFPGWAAAA